MTIVDRGAGTPIVLVPGLQGDWEYLRRAVDALSRQHRVITFSLGDERGGLDGLAAQVEAALDDRGLARAAICGVSFGGRVALRFAARHPERTNALVLVSVPGPRWHLKRSHRWCARHPIVSAPVVFPALFARMRRELNAAMPDPSQRRRLMRHQIGLVFRGCISPSRMAARALLIDWLDVKADCAAITAPTLIISGEPHLDHVVPANGTCEYAALIAGSRGVTLARTGHLGCITRPEAFADLVHEFLAQ
jgi:pimeloyl-ACP methyl ester carboxylesterase